MFSCIYELPSQNKSLCYLLTYLPTHPSTHIPTYLPTQPPNHPPTYLPTYLPRQPPTHLPTYLRTHLPTYPPTHLPTYPTTHLPTYLPTHLPNHPPTHLSSYLPTYQWRRSNSEFTSFPRPLLFPSLVGRAEVFLKPHPPISCNFFLADSNIFTSTRSVQIEFARPHVSGFTLSSSANLLGDPQLMQKRYLYSSSISVLLPKLSHQAPVRSFNLFMASNSSVRRGKKPQNIELPFGITEVYGNHS